MITFFGWTRHQLARAVALVLFGFLAGALTTTLATGARTEALTMENERLTDGLAELQEKYDRLLQQPAADRLLVKDVVVQLVDFRGDERTELQLRRFVRELMQEHIIGEPVSDIDHLLMQKLVHDRNFTIEKRAWHIQVVMSSITWETYFMYVRADDALTQ